MVYWVLIIGSIAIPISGMLMSGAAGYGLAVFGVELLSPNMDPNQGGKVIALVPNIVQLGHFVHQWFSYLLIGALVLHIVAAVKHSLFDNDATLLRMFGKKIE